MAVVTQTMQDQVTELYLGFFGRAPDAVGFGYWTNAMANGNATVNTIANGFASTPEFIANYGGLTPVQQVTKIYLNVLNRAPDAGGLAYWTGLLNTGSSIGSVVYGITSAAFAQTGTADGLLVQNKVKVGEYFAITLSSNDTDVAKTAYTNVTSNPASVPAAEAELSHGTGGTWALTTGVDTLTKGPFAQFVGTVTNAATQTLNAGDSIEGIGAGNELKIVDTANFAGNAPMAGVSVRNVQEVSVQSTHVSTNVYNMSTTSGVTKVSSTNSTGGAGVNVAFTGLAAGTEVAAQGSASTAGNITNFAYTTVTSSPTVSFIGGVNSQFVRATAGTATSAVINSLGGVNGTLATGAAAANDVKLTGAANTVATLTVNAATNLRTTLTASDFAATGAALVVNGAAGNVDLGINGVYKTIDASSLVGGVTVNLSTQTTSFKGGLGNDAVTAGAVATAIAANASIDAGTGVDTVAAVLVNGGNAAVFKNFEQIDVSGLGAVTLDSGLMTNSTVTGVVIGGAYTTGAGISNLVETASGFNLSVEATGNVGNALTLGFKAASVTGTTDAVNVAFADSLTGAGADTDAGAVTMQGIELVNVSSAGVTKGTGFFNVAVLDGNSIQTVTVTGANATFLSVADQALIAPATLSALTTIDASAATGRFTYLESADATSKGLTILGSQGNDTIVVQTHVAVAGATGANTYGSDSITLSTGTDTVDVSLATAQATGSSAATTTITGAGTGDVLVFSAGLAAQANFKAAATNTSAALNLGAALDLIAANAGGVGNAAWGTFAGNTYVVYDTAAGAALAAGDQVVKLVGVVSLTTSTVTAGDLSLVI